MRLKNLLYWLVVSLSISSCSERIDIELGTTYNRLAVYGELTTDTLSHFVRLQKSGDYYLNEESDAVSDAIVEISYDDTSIMYTENPAGSGIYLSPSNFFGITGKTYFLTISNVDVNEDGDNEVYRASSFIQAINPIDSIDLKYTKLHFFSGWEIMVYAWDRPDVRNFYSFKATLNGKLLTDTLTEYRIQSDDFFNGSYTNGITSQILDDSNGTEKAYPGDTIGFEINGITEEFFNFIFEAQSEAFRSIPLFSGPPANITSNISNGALGFFTAYSIERAWKIVPEYSGE